MTFRLSGLEAAVRLLLSLSLIVVWKLLFALPAS